MSENKINIQLELDTILNDIRNGNSDILAEIIKKLLLADYEIFNSITQMGNQLGSLQNQITELTRIVNEMLPEDELNFDGATEILNADDDE